MIQIVRHDNATSFLNRSHPWLLGAEAENNLVLGISTQLRTGRHPYEEPIYHWVIETGTEVAGCALRTPPFGMVLTRMPADAISILVDDVGALYSTLPSVVGPESAASPFAAGWSHRTGCSYHVGMQQRIYALTEVRCPASARAGNLRLATANDLKLVDGWASEFARETGVPANPNENLARTLIEERCLYVWDDGDTRSMAAARGPTPNGVRIGFVYTPVQWRGRGYASACVAALSQLQLDHGKSLCFLYTDLANATSNSIYQEIGYKPVSDSVMCMFT